MRLQPPKTAAPGRWTSPRPPTARRRRLHSLRGVRDTFRYARWAGRAWHTHSDRRRRTDAVRVPQLGGRPSTTLDASRVVLSRIGRRAERDRGAHHDRPRTDLVGQPRSPRPSRPFNVRPVIPRGLSTSARSLVVLSGVTGSARSFRDFDTELRDGRAAAQRRSGEARSGLLLFHGLTRAGSESTATAIEEPLGRGGMGVVYRAHQIALEGDVALKVIAPELLDDPTRPERFLREARGAAAIEHPNVIPVYDGRRGRRHRVPRHALRRRRRRPHAGAARGPLSRRARRTSSRQAGEALDASTRAGLVHRDVKPGNVLLEADDHVFVTRLRPREAGAVPGRPDPTGNGSARSTSWRRSRSAATGRCPGRRLRPGRPALLHAHRRRPVRAEGDEAKLWAHLSNSRRPRRRCSARSCRRRSTRSSTARWPRPPGTATRPTGDVGRAAEAAAVRDEDPSQERAQVAGRRRGPGRDERPPSPRVADDRRAGDRRAAGRRARRRLAPTVPMAAACRRRRAPGPARSRPRRSVGRGDARPRRRDPRTSGSGRTGSPSRRAASGCRAPRSTG